ncbi:hypothetical protein MMC16_007094 [Acarospora aff. strigata]|nr:hypothetical protein [Acarospora aff. strigata]
MAPRLPPTPACQAYSPRVPNPYGYQPSLGAGVTFIVLFACSALIHAWQSFRNRKTTPWLWVFFLGAIFECVGWIARTLNHNCAYSVTYFKVQIAILISAPAFIQAGIYAILWVMTLLIGRHILPLPPKIYVITILVLDFVCLSLQAIGGGLAGAAFSKGTSTEPGTITMVVGIVIQLVSTCVFSVLLNLALYRGFDTIQKNKHLMILSGATLLAVACMIIRGVYRSIELLQGWRGALITSEKYTIALEGSMMILALVIFNVFNPGALFAKAKATLPEHGSAPLAEVDRIEKGREGSE